MKMNIETYASNKYEHTASVIASKRMLDSAGIKLRKYEYTGRKIEILL